MINALRSRGKILPLNKPLVMGILNVTPDSFSDGGQFKTCEDAVRYALNLVKQGADILDIGGESTGPGSKVVSSDEELSRVLPVLNILRQQTDAWISVDTYKADVAEAALNAGAEMINDVTALRSDPDMVSIIQKYGVPVVMMYSKDSTPRTTRTPVAYDDIITTLKQFFAERLEFVEASGVRREQVILDPGMGAFVSADPKYSLQILKRLKELGSFDSPILVGASRKSFIGQVLDLPLHERLEGTLAASAVAVLNGASLVRVHDVVQTRRALDMVHAIMQS